jgi:hypothetical protein
LFVVEIEFEKTGASRLENEIENMSRQQLTIPSTNAAPV